MNEKQYNVKSRYIIRIKGNKMTEQTKKLSKTQLKRWKLALKEAAKINRKIKKNKNAILIDTENNMIISNTFKLRTNGGISTLGFISPNCIIAFGDNDPEYDNGFMYNTLDEIRGSFRQYKVYGEV